MAFLFSANNLRGYKQLAFFFTSHTKQLSRSKSGKLGHRLTVIQIFLLPSFLIGLFLCICLCVLILPSTSSFKICMYLNSLSSLHGLYSCSTFQGHQKSSNKRQGTTTSQTSSELEMVKLVQNFNMLNLYNKRSYIKILISQCNLWE